MYDYVQRPKIQITIRAMISEVASLFSHYRNTELVFGVSSVESISFNIFKQLCAGQLYRLWPSYVYYKSPRKAVKATWGPALKVKPKFGDF